MVQVLHHNGDPSVQFCPFSALSYSAVRKDSDFTFAESNLEREVSAEKAKVLQSGSHGKLSWNVIGP